jgi:hypothetical protein
MTVQASWASREQDVMLITFQTSWASREQEMPVESMIEQKSWPSTSREQVMASITIYKHCGLNSSCRMDHPSLLRTVLQVRVECTGCGSRAIQVSSQQNTVTILLASYQVSARASHHQRCANYRACFQRRTKRNSRAEKQEVASGTVRKSWSSREHEVVSMGVQASWACREQNTVS